jgi:hypothetical protein
VEWEERKVRANDGREYHRHQVAKPKVFGPFSQPGLIKLIEQRHQVNYYGLGGG